MAKILIVDDEKMICEEFREILQEDEHEVDTALNGEQAIHMVQEKQYDLVFLDVLMPRMEGSEVFSEIRKLSNVPVAIMSGFIPSHKEKEIIASGAVACFKKPLDLGKIKKLIQSVEDRGTVA
ncbi:MAG: response regulator [Candidatus Omnitrophota bacterium]